MNRTSAPGVGILVAKESTALALREVFLRSGYQVVIEAEESTTCSRIESANVLAWVSDTLSEEIFDWLVGTGKLLLPANNAPASEDKKAFHDWSSDLVLQLNVAMSEIYGDALPANLKPLAAQTSDIWLLVGSAGAPAAVQRFLNSFKTLPPVGFVYAQHFSVSEQQVLSQLSAENAMFSMEVGVGLHPVEPGRVIVVPPQCQISFDNFGNITSARSEWDPPYTPNISQLFTLFAQSKFSATGVIVFSGMGDDGMTALELLHRDGTRIWSQSPQTAICDSMPQAAVDTGLVDFLGDPEQLARALQKLYR